MGLFINAATKIAATNQRLIMIKTNHNQEVYLRDYVLCFQRNAHPIAYKDLFIHSYNLPDLVLKPGNELYIYVGKGEPRQVKIRQGIGHIYYWDLDVSLFEQKGIFYSLEQVIRHDIKSGL